MKTKTKERILYVTEVADELAALFLRSHIKFDDSLTTAVVNYAARKGAVNTAKMLTYALAVEEDQRSFSYLVETLKNPAHDEAGVIEVFIPAKKEVPSE